MATTSAVAREGGEIAGASDRAQSWCVAVLNPPHEAPTSEVFGVIHLFERVADEEGWQAGGALHADVSRSVYFTLRPAGSGSECDGRLLAGGLQLVHSDGSSPLPNAHVWPELQKIVDPAFGNGGCAHVSVLALAREWRGHAGAGSAAAVWLLCAALWRHCVETGVRELWLEVTPTMLRCYRLWGLPLVIRGELREHWGEPCYPCSLSVREAVGALAEKAIRSSTYRRILAGALGIPADAVTAVSTSARDPS